MIKGKGYFYTNEDHIDFSNGPDGGVLSCSTSSYEIGSAGEFELTKEETKQMFVAMRNHYLAKDDKFWKKPDQKPEADKFKAEKLAIKFCEQYNYQQGSDERAIAVNAFCVGFKISPKKEGCRK
jgi:hypothetical protein